MSDTTESAVNFAASMIRKGQYIGSAINIAANYYKVDKKEVQRGLAARSGASQKGKPKPRRVIPNTCTQCENEPTHKITYFHGMAGKSIYYTCEAHIVMAAYGRDEYDITKTEVKELKATKQKSA